MKGKNAFEAMEGIDHKYILEAAPDAVPLRVENRPHRIRVAAVAATVSALAVTAVCLGVGVMKQSGDTPPVIPPITGTQDAELPTDGENTSAEGNTLPADSGEEETAAPQNGSYTTDLYTVAEIDGKHYISFADGNEKPANSGGNAMVVQGIYFSSIEEMRRKFLEGDFTADEVKNLKSQLTLTDKGFEIPDMTNLYDAVLPEGWDVSYVYMNDGCYTISVINSATYDEKEGDDTGESASIAFYTDDYYNSSYKYFYLDQLEKVKDGLIEDITDVQGIPCQVYEYKTNISKIRSVFMQIENDNGMVEILMNYCMEHKDQDMVNQSVPYAIYMYGEDNGRKYQISLNGFENGFDVDVLKMFSVKPYKGS